MAAAPSLLLFARAPEPGRVKTRLAPAIGAEAAARLYGAFLQDAARVYGPPASWAPVLCADPHPDAPPFPDLFRAPWRVRRQSGGDLGARQCEAFRAEFEGGAPAAAAVGSDHPALPRRRLEEVFERLEAGASAAVIPAADGGYCVLGLRRDAPMPVDQLFREIPWSSRDVLAATIARFAAFGAVPALLAPSYDVDRPEDLGRLAADIESRDPAAADFPHATARVLRGLRRGSLA
jgi:hypothetical protein